jgi:hypothetical protein
MVLAPNGGRKWNTGHTKVLLKEYV